MTTDKDQEYRAEAERLAELPPDMQRKLIGQHRAIAGDKAVPKADRIEAKERANALERHLRRLARKKGKSM